MANLKLYNRADVVNFLGVTLEATSFVRMEGFIDNGKTLNPKLYERHYIDEKSDRKSIIGYSCEIAYTFDRCLDDTVHTTIADVHDLEKTDVTLPVVTVNFNEAGSEAGSFKAKKRLYSVIPDSDGTTPESYQYAGVFASNGEIITGEVTSTDNFKTCTFIVK